MDRGRQLPLLAAKNGVVEVLLNVMRTKPRTAKLSLNLMDSVKKLVSYIPKNLCHKKMSQLKSI